MAVPFITTNTMRSICKAAGVHLYANDDTWLEASGNYMLITTARGGCDKVISLPAPSTVYDIWNRKLIGTQVTSFEADVPAFDTGFYFIGDDAELKAFLKHLE